MGIAVGDFFKFKINLKEMKAQSDIQNEFKKHQINPSTLLAKVLSIELYFFSTMNLQEELNPEQVVLLRGKKEAEKQRDQEKRQV